MSFFPGKGAGRRFGQKNPPLSTAIKQILDRYPDGQIFKVNPQINIQLLYAVVLVFAVFTGDDSEC